MKTKTMTVTRRMVALTLAAAILLSLIAGLFIGKIVFAQTLEVNTPAGIVFADASAAPVYDVNGHELTMLTISVSNSQEFDFVEVEWSTDYTFSNELLHWGAEKYEMDQFTTTNEIVDFDGNVIYVRLRATIDGIPSEWSTPVEIIVREVPVDEIPEETIPTEDQPTETGTPVTGTPVTGTPVTGTPITGTPVESTPVESTPVIGTPIVIEFPTETEHVHTVSTRETRHVEATCLQNGVIESETYCTECNVVLDKTSETLIALGHAYTEIERVEPQIGQTGYVVYECTRCGDRYTVTLPALVKDHEHAYTQKVETRIASCTNSGMIKLFCDCGAYVEEYVAPLGHIMGNWHVVRAATETAEGLEERTCTRCGYAETRPIAALTHTHSTATRNGSTIEATCITAGKSTVETYCTKCGVVIDTKETVIPALGHTFGEWHIVRAATETTEGLEERTCTRCGHSENRTIPVLTHTHSTATRNGSTIEATCTTAGKSTVETYCTKCGVVIDTKETEIPALGHDMGEWYVVTPATSSSKGLEQRDCTRCDYNETRAIDVDNSNCEISFQTMRRTNDNTISFSIVNKDIDVIEITVSNGTETQTIRNNTPNTGVTEVTNMLSGKFSINGTYTADVVGYKMIDGVLTPVARNSASVELTGFEANHVTDITTNVEATTTTTESDTTDTTDITTETVETVEVVEVVETIESVESVEVIDTFGLTLIEG